MSFYTSDKYQAPIFRNCHRCKNPVSSDFKYCPHCGSSLLTEPIYNQLNTLPKVVIPPNLVNPRELVVEPEAISLDEYCPRCGQRIARPKTLNEHEQPGGSSCFIVTACNADMETLDTFYNFRDNILLGWSMGEKLVHFYYRFSPRVANIIQKYKTLQSLILLVLLRPLAVLLRVILLRFK